jgi:hypothetical protein
MPMKTGTRNYAAFWIPAFAGMTYAGVFQTASQAGWHVLCL